MSPNDKPEFSRCLAAAMELYQATLSKEAVAVWWGVLSKYALQDVKSALTAHISDPQRGQFPPKPADVIAKIPSGHPGPEEAWSMVAHALGDEGATLFVTEPMRAAFFRADALADDPIAARMAFLDVYRRKIASAGPAQWSPILGHDKHRRDGAIEQALVMGLIGQSAALPLLSPPAADRIIEAMEARPLLTQLVEDA